MKKNLPVTNNEIVLKDSDVIISMTDLKGQITYINNTFVTISGFTEDELIGQSHNIVRHPDMPSAAFEDLWNRIKQGETWTGMVKNRCKNGDYYWVEAFVSPIYDGGQLVGYQSVRSKPTKKQIEDAEQLYRKLNSKELTQLPKKFSFSDISLRTRLFSALFLAAILPILGDVLWSLELVSSRVMVGLALLSPVILFISAILVNKTIFQPLDKVSDSLRKITNGDLTQSLKVETRDEIGVLQLNCKIMQARLQTILGKISEVSDKTNNNARSLSASSDETVAMIKSQHDASQQLHDFMTKMSEITQLVVANTKKAIEAVQNTTTESKQGKDIVVKVRNSILELEKDIQSSARIIAELDEKSQDISAIMNTISGIAEQTNLLALNAAIEAARAGEQGRGFAVVADEVRTLAGRTQEATVEINTLVEALQQGVGDSVNKINKGTSQASQAVEEVEQSEKSLAVINEAVAQISVVNDEISSAAASQFEMSMQANSSVETISSLSEKILELAHNNNNESKNMIEMSELLNQQFKVFKLK